MGTRRNMNVNARESSDMRTISLPFITQCNSPKDHIVIYPCGICNGLHLGVMVLPATRHTADESANRLIFSLQRDIHRVREIGRSQEDNVRQLEEEIERLLTEYF